MSLDRLTTEVSHEGGVPETHRLTTANSLRHQFESFLLTAYLELAPTTVKDYRYKLSSFARYCAGAAMNDVHQVSPQHIREYLAGMLDSNSPTSVKDYYKVINRFFNWLVEEGALDISPMMRVKPPRVPQKIIKVFTPEHIRNILLLCALPPGSDNCPQD